MKILAASHRIPEQCISNELILQLVREQNRANLSENELDEIQYKIERFFIASGTRVRYVVDGSEKAIDLAINAGKDALKKSFVAPVEVDFLIYAGVGRGWIEPAVANVIQTELGLVNANCFDVMDACASWLQALQIAHSFIHSGVYRIGIIVTCEAGFKDYADFNFADISDLDTRLATFTIGEAATATVVSNENSNDDFYFRFKNFGEYYDLCMLPLENFREFTTASNTRPYTPLQFFSLSQDLLFTGIRRMIETFKADHNLSGQIYDICFGHTVSEKGSRIVALGIDVDPLIYFSTHPDYGNTVSSSVPLGISLAIQNNSLHRGNRVLVLVGSAGISLGFATFTF